MRPVCFRNGVLYHLQALREKMELIRVGGRKNGHWEFHIDCEIL